MIILAGLVLYTGWTFICMFVLILDMHLAWHKYRAGRNYTVYRWSHEDSYWKTLLWIRSL
jgi:hypothetical protein